MRRNYKITYQLKEPIMQERTLVSREEYDEYRNSIITLDSKAPEQEKQKALEFRRKFPDNFFVVGSPLFNAIKSGKVYHYGGDTDIKMEIVWK